SVPRLQMKAFRQANGGPSVRVSAEPRGANSRTPRRPRQARSSGRRSLGIGVRPVTAIEAAQMECPADSRLRVSRATRLAADILVGDFLLAIDGQPVTTAADVLMRLRAAQERDTVQVRVWREGQEFDLVLGWKE
ncbi:PDZ domain-containing protein, partial [Planctomycetota bacterium]|nr:PDZ domain-containing protein [Planctomycetota bacterium]